MKKIKVLCIIFAAIIVLFLLNILGQIAVRMLIDNHLRNYESASGTMDPNKAAQIQSQAVTSGDYSLCNKIASGYVMSLATPRFDCYKEVLTKWGNVGMCDKVAVKIDPDTNYSYYPKDFCLIAVAVKEKKSDICLLVSDKEYIPGRLSTSLADCYSEVAVANKDIRICDNISLRDNNPSGVFEPRNLCKDDVKQRNN